ncbi:MAG: RNA-binding protein [Roseiarcus sp.]|uniref:RNA-binding protein n=1 Tax=Roseiarcus sp. TaxID=1969460 RepID=UPI003C19FFCA
MSNPDAIEDSGPERTCAATGWKGPPEAMLRFALSADGVVTPDIRRRLPGRGVWIRLDATTVRQAAARQVFARAFRAKAEAAPGLADDVDRLLEADALQFLSLVNKAGQIVAGAFKVEAAIASGKVVGLIHASDGSVDGALKLDRQLRSLEGEAAAAPRINIFASRQLDLALGRTNVIHAALIAGEASIAFLAKAERLTQFRTGVATPSAPAAASVDAGAAAAPSA